MSDKLEAFAFDLTDDRARQLWAEIAVPVTLFDDVHAREVTEEWLRPKGEACPRRYDQRLAISTILRTDRLVAPSMPVSSSTLPGRPAAAAVMAHLVTDFSTPQGGGYPMKVTVDLQGVMKWQPDDCRC